MSEVFSNILYSCWILSHIFILFMAVKATELFSQVEAGEKKKKKTGRAKRRIQYNRRFVNVVETFGRKKGPNSNS